MAFIINEINRNCLKSLNDAWKEWKAYGEKREVGMWKTERNRCLQMPQFRVWIPEGCHHYEGFQQRQRMHSLKPGLVVKSTKFQVYQQEFVLTITTNIIWLMVKLDKYDTDWIKRMSGDISLFLVSQISWFSDLRICFFSLLNIIINSTFQGLGLWSDKICKWRTCNLCNSLFNLSCWLFLKMFLGAFFPEKADRKSGEREGQDMQQSWTSDLAVVWHVL